MFKESFYYKVKIRRSRRTSHWADHYITKGVIETFAYRNAIVFPRELVLYQDYMYEVSPTHPDFQLLLLTSPANIIKFLGTNILTRSKLLEFILCTRS